MFVIYCCWLWSFSCFVENTRHCDFVLGRSISSALSPTWCMSVFVHKELSLWCTLVMTLQWNTISASRLTKWVCADDLSFMSPFSLFVMVVLKPWFPLSDGVTCTVSPNTLYTPCKCVSNDFADGNVLGFLSKQSELRKHDLIQTIKPDSHLKVFCPLPAPAFHKRWHSEGGKVQTEPKWAWLFHKCDIVTQ